MLGGNLGSLLYGDVSMMILYKYFSQKQEIEAAVNAVGDSNTGFLTRITFFTHNIRPIFIAGLVIKSFGCQFVDDIND